MWSALGHVRRHAMRCLESNPKQDQANRQNRQRSATPLLGYDLAVRRVQISGIMGIQTHPYSHVVHTQLRRTSRTRWHPYFAKLLAQPGPGSPGHHWTRSSGTARTHVGPPGMTPHNALQGLPFGRNYYRCKSLINSKPISVSKKYRNIFAGFVNSKNNKVRMNYRRYR